MNSVKKQFNRDMKNLLKKNGESISKLQQQHETAIKQLGKHDRETAVLKDEIRRLKDGQEKFTADRDRLKQLLDNEKRRSIDIKKEDLDQLKKAKSKCAQVKDENATLRQITAQLEAESASKIKNGNTTAEAKKARIKEDKSKLKEMLTQLEAENKKLKSDLSNALNDAKKSMAHLTRAKDDDNKTEQRLANLEN
nr:unnamed protein product [Callosobruchus chinensis]CAH7753901.1 unnamed protein product [Callosobruchus chinensis]